MECHEDRNDEISMACSPDTEAKVTLIDCMYSKYIYVEREMSLFQYLVSQVTQMQIAMVQAPNGAYHTTIPPLTPCFP